MSTLTDQRAVELKAEKAAAAKAKKKTKAKRDEHGRFVKDEADLDTPSLRLHLLNLYCSSFWAAQL